MKWTWAGFLAALGLTITGAPPTAAADADAAAKKPGDGGATVIRHADPASAQTLVTGGKVTVLDLRTDAEFAGGHIAGAKQLDFNAPDFKTKLAALNRDQPYLVHCASGRRSTKALDTFKALGFKNVTHLDGGFNAWKTAGKPVVR